MTEIREQHYWIDVPGDWERVESADEATIAYAERQGSERLSIVLLSVRPSFSFSDPVMLLEQYMQHRAKYEEGKEPGLQAFPATARQLETGWVEGEWSAFDPVTGRRARHRVLSGEGMTADFRYDALGMSEEEFAERAATVLASAGASPG